MGKEIDKGRKLYTLWKDERTSPEERGVARSKFLEHIQKHGLSERDFANREEDQVYYRNVKVYKEHHKTLLYALAAFKGYPLGKKRKDHHFNQYVMCSDIQLVELLDDLEYHKGELDKILEGTIIGYIWGNLPLPDAPAETEDNSKKKKKKRRVLDPAVYATAAQVKSDHGGKYSNKKKIGGTE